MTESTIRQRTPPSSTESPPLTPETKAVDSAYASADDSGADSDGYILPSATSAGPDHDRKLPEKEALKKTITGNYVQSTTDKQKVLPPITISTLLDNINWVSFIVLTVTPSIALYGLLTTNFNWKTAVWSVVYYFITGLGITAGYHRLWAHRSYNASPPLQYALAMMGTGAVEGSIKWWSRGHRAHHRYTDTDLDPYDAHKGFFWSHIGWMLVKPRRQIGNADVSDLSRNPVVRWQHKWYLYLIIGFGFLVPTIVAGLWGDFRGGFFYAGALRLTFVHHSTFCVNSLAHWLGEAPFDDKHSPRDHFITALCTVGEGYHNFHHQFPMDYRNAIKWYQYDPTKWFIVTMYWLGLASHLKAFPSNEIKKGQYTMKLKKLVAEGDAIQWPVDNEKLPVVSWEDFQEEAKHRPLIVIHGYIHDVTSFAEEHPGGANLINKSIGTDATTAFFGGVYDHSNASHNLLAMMRVGIIDGGYEVEALKSNFKYSPINPDRVQSYPAQPYAQVPVAGKLTIEPSQRLKVVRPELVDIPRIKKEDEGKATQLGTSLVESHDGSVYE